MTIGPTPVDPESRAVAVEQYAAEYGVSQGQASQRLALQERGSGLNMALESALGDRYGGVWFDHHGPDGRFIVGLPPGASQQLAGKAVAQRDLVGDVSFVAVRTSMSELESARRGINRTLEPLIARQLVSTAIDASANAVLLEVADGLPEPERELVTKTVDSQKVGVNLRQVPPASLRAEQYACDFTTYQSKKVVNCDRSIRGGVWIYDWRNPARCMSGFNVLGLSGGNPFVMTAGHCLQGNQSMRARTSAGDPYDIGGIHNFINGEIGDAGIVTVAETSFWRGGIDPWVVQTASPNTSSNHAYVIQGQGSSYTGLFVCGMTLNLNTQCGTVVALNQRVSFGNVTVDYLTRVNTCNTGPGDSGGPWYSTDRVARGTLVGGGPPDGFGCRSFYNEVMRSNFILNTRVRTP